MKTYLIADLMNPDEGETAKWDINEWKEDFAKERVERWEKDNLGQVRVYEFEDGNIREVDKDDFQRYIIPLRAPKLTQDTRLGGVLANEDPKELRRQEAQYFDNADKIQDQQFRWGEPDVTRDAYDYLPDEEKNL